jgi:signal transduction histidine kinase
LTNARKHAQATHLQVTLDYGSADKMRLLVEDDGSGSDDARGGFGLLGVRERAQLLGGEVRVRTTPGQGFALEVEVPG